jgi:acetyl-CoA carboxylase biotin carboxyl carrier protein
MGEGDVQNAESDNTLLYIGFILLILVGVGAYFYFKDQQDKSATVPAPLAPAASAPTPVVAAPVSAAPAAPAVVADNYITIKSPMIGTFYRKSGPDKPVFAEVGTEVEPGKVVCIIEAMKLFNEIESEIKGRVVKVLVEDASPVEYDQPLFLVDPA